MNHSEGRFCRLYRPIGALLLLLAILFLLLRSGNLRAPVAAVPAAEPTHAAPTEAPATLVPASAPTIAPPTAVPTPASTPVPTVPFIAMPGLNVPAAADLTTEGVNLSGTGEPGATVEVWDGATRIGAAVVGADGVWSLLAKLGEGAHQVVVRTVDAAGNVLNEMPAVEITVPAEMALPQLNLPTAADLTAEGVNLSGTGEPGATVEVWDGATLVGTAVVGADGVWSLLAKLDEGAHALVVRTVDATGGILNESGAVEVTVPEVQAPAAAEAPLAVGQEYIVQPGDWLRKLARQFYGDPELYPLIIEGTNAKAAVDSTFSRITNPNLIWVGQKLWIPGLPTGK